MNFLRIILLAFVTLIFVFIGVLNADEENECLCLPENIFELEGFNVSIFKTKIDSCLYNSPSCEQAVIDIHLSMQEGGFYAVEFLFDDYKEYDDFIIGENLELNIKNFEDTTFYNSIKYINDSICKVKNIRKREVGGIVYNIIFDDYIDIVQVNRLVEDLNNINLIENPIEIDKITSIKKDLKEKIFKESVYLYVSKKLLLEPRLFNVYGAEICININSNSEYYIIDLTKIYGMNIYFLTDNNYNSVIKIINYNYEVLK